jgi:hypothetical protein
MLKSLTTRVGTAAGSASRGVEGMTLILDGYSDGKQLTLERL